MLEAAQELFLSQGFEATSMHQIAARAGVTRRTLYAKWADKQEIFDAAVRRMLEDRREILVDTGLAAPTFERLVRFGENALDVALDPAVLDLCRVAVAESRRFPRLATLIDEQIKHGRQARLENILRDEMAHKRIPDGDPKEMACLLLSGISGQAKEDALLTNSVWSKQRRKNWARAAVTLFLQGAGATRPKPSRPFKVIEG
jgi:AcrR family transcriptional regulator